MAIYKFDPTGKFAVDLWGYQTRPDFVPNIGGRTGYWGVSGSNPWDDQAFDTPDQAVGAGALFNTQGEAQAIVDRERAKLGGSPTPSQAAYSAAMRAQGIGEDELPYGHSPAQAMAAYAGRGMPVADYVQLFLRNNGGWGNVADLMLARKPPKLAEILGNKADATEDARKAALVDWLMRMYGRMPGGTSTIAQT